MLQPFDYRGVSLEEGRLRRQVEEVRDYYLRLPNDDLLRGYRLRAGKPAPGRDPGGLYASHNPFGQILSGLARLHAATGDRACREKAEALLAGWAECIEPDGFFFITREPDLVPYYYDKMVCGLVDMYAYCGSEEALAHLERITDWAMAHLSRARLYANPVTNDGGEWYTLSENLYRAYLATGEAKYRDFAQVWEYREYWDYFARGGDIFSHPPPCWYHAYSHVNTLSSLAAAYLVGGDPRDLAALRRAYDFLWKTQLWVTGGYGPNECLMPRGQLAAMLTETGNHFETQCGSWAGFKLGKYLVSFTGDARYGDWMELLVINGIGASIPMSPAGEVFYYSDYSLGGAAKRNIGVGWACCSGTRPQAVSDYQNLIYFREQGSLYVNLFASSTVTWEVRAGERATLTQRTQFPEEDRVELELRVGRPRRFTINLRRPGWLASPARVSVNGSPQPVRANARHWLVLERVWHDGDRVTVRLPMGFRLSRADPEREFPAAICYGPVTMAVQAQGGTNPSASFNYTRLGRALRPVTGQPLTFRLAADPAVVVRPFYQFTEGERYFVYLDPARSLVRLPCSELTYSPGWNDHGQWRATNVVGATAEGRAVGGALRLHGFRYDDAGMVEVAVDGKRVGVVDQYGLRRGEPAHWDFPGLGPGEHTVRLTLLPNRNPASGGSFINVAAIELSRGER